jgi:hypothetical protein
MWVWLPRLAIPEARFMIDPIGRPHATQKCITTPDTSSRFLDQLLCPPAVLPCATSVLLAEGLPEFSPHLRVVGSVDPVRSLPLVAGVVVELLVAQWR